jgi:hypothetical protein
MGALLGQITDGRSAWAEFYDGVTAVFDANESSLPAIGLAVLVLVVMVLNVRLARWVVRRWWGGSRRGADGER